MQSILGMIEDFPKKPETHVPLYVFSTTPQTDSAMNHLASSMDYAMNHLASSPDSVMNHLESSTDSAVNHLASSISSPTLTVDSNMKNPINILDDCLSNGGSLSKCLSVSKIYTQFFGTTGGGSQTTNGGSQTTADIMSISSHPSVNEIMDSMLTGSGDSYPTTLMIYPTTADELSMTAHIKPTETSSYFDIYTPSSGASKIPIHAKPVTSNLPKRPGLFQFGPSLKLNMTKQVPVVPTTSDWTGGYEIDGTKDSVPSIDKGSVPSPDQGYVPSTDQGYVPSIDKGSVPSTDKGYVLSVEKGSTSSIASAVTSSTVSTTEGVEVATLSPFMLLLMKKHPHANVIAGPPPKHLRDRNRIQNRPDDIGWG